MLDMRGDAKTLLEGSRHRPGYKALQNGPWDDRFLCKKHEDEAGAGDEYAIEFCRALSRGDYVPYGPEAFQIRNPVPDHLMRFIYGTVWRHAMAPINAGLRLNLGPYEARIRSALFDDGPLDLQAIVGLSNLVDSAGKAVPMGLAPYQQKLGQWRTWHFIIGILDVQLKTDGRPFPKTWEAHLANGNDPVVLHQTDPMHLATVPLLRPITDNLREAAKNFKSKQ